jgi:hypothetical protein
MITCVNGIPGSGKNVLVTKICLHHYKKTNNSIRRLIRKIKKEPIWINNVYSTYPILLKKTKREKIYSNIVTIYDLVPSNRFLNHAVIVIDETQAFYDSEDHKEFPKEIAIFNQFHRHFGIDDIYYVSQHPSRILKKLRILACEFDKIKRFICIPFIHLAFMHIVRYFEFDDYGKYNHPKKEAKTYDVKNKYMLFFAGKVFKAYDSKYLKVLNIDKPLYNRGVFKKIDLSEKEIKYIYRDNL